jgi:hypothetical protein
MDIFQSIIAIRVIFILGIVNLVMITLIFLSCRCIPGLRITGKLMQYPAYKRFYKYHCYIWWPFWTSVVVHAIFGIAFVSGAL